mmetsp:Transcript_7713/g.12584  ORF Transcript_7713/g.12584 Transcript_7713/m.12584 type:complete len:186 (+) Transcript_7713:373-930(+)
MTLHKVPSLYRHVHSVHHSNHDLYASDAFRFSMADFWLSVIPSILSVNTLENHTLTRIIYDIVITYLIVINHCGYDILLSPDHLLSSYILTGPRAHSRHHRHHDHCYSQFVPLLDRVCGTNKPNHKQKLAPSLLKVFSTGFLVVALVDYSRLLRFVAFYTSCLGLMCLLWLQQQKQEGSPVKKTH